MKTLEDKKKIGIFCGSFIPLHKGHLNILEQAESIFGADNVIIAVGENPAKKQILTEIKNYHQDLYFPEINPVETIKKQLPSRNIEGYSGFLTDFIWEKEKEGYDVTIIRGLRNVDDFIQESTQLAFLRDMKPNIKVLFLMCESKYSHISSSAYREFEKIKNGSGHIYLAHEGCL